VLWQQVFSQPVNLPDNLSEGNATDHSGPRQKRIIHNAMMCTPQRWWNRVHNRCQNRPQCCNVRSRYSAWLSQSRSAPWSAGSTRDNYTFTVVYSTVTI